MELKNKTSRALVGVIFMIGFTCSPLWAATSIVGSKHDFSAGNTSGNTPFAGVFATDPSGLGFGLLIDEVCVFCHTPHGASTDSGRETNTLLWNRKASTPSGGYAMYSSASFSTPSLLAPTGISMMCMSCHDGVTSVAANVSGVDTLLNAPGRGNPTVTIAFGMDAPGSIGNVYDGGLLGWGANLGEQIPGSSGPINLSNDHPISFAYPTASTVLREPTNPLIKLFGASKKMECATCHTVHDPTNVPFLAIPNTNSNMCRDCHLL
jgi:hypothetical protein